MAQLFRNVKDLVEERIKFSAIILWEILLVCETSGTFVFCSISFYKSLLRCHKRENVAEKKDSTSPAGVSRTLCRPVRSYS